MKSVGLIVEYNPFHNGHIYHIKEAKRRAKADVVVAVMSGNFVQRGMPALIDKWKRAEIALKYGVDLIIELPVEISVQSADYFARGSISLLQKLGIDTLVFGTDVKSNSSFDYEEFGKKVLMQQDKMDKYFQTLQAMSQSYPAQMTAVYRHFFPEISLDFSSPNHILGLTYARENARHDQPMKILALPRQKNFFYNKDNLKKVASATDIRDKIILGEKETVQDFIPSEMLNLLETSVSWEDYFPFLKYRILSSTFIDLLQIYQMNEELEYRVQAKIQKTSNFSELINKLKTKRYTQNRLQRLLVYTLIGIKKELLIKGDREIPIRILGFTDKGRQFLKEKKQEKTLPFISKIGSKVNGMELTLRADKIYQLGSKEILEQNYGRIPILC